MRSEVQHAVAACVDDLATAEIYKRASSTQTYIFNHDEVMPFLLEKSLGETAPLAAHCNLGDGWLS